MKSQRQKTAVSLLCAAMCIASMAACKKDDEKSKAQSIDIAQSTVTMDCFDSATLSLTAKNIDKTVWKSSDEGVATVDEKGVLKSFGGVGKTTITASNESGDIFDTCEVTVFAKSLPVFSVQNDAIVPLGSTYTVEMSVSYAGLDVTSDVEYAVEETTGGGVATASVSGNALTFTGNAIGKAEYTAYIETCGETYAEKINVEVRSTDITWIVEGGVNNEIRLTKTAQFSTADVKIYDKGAQVSAENIEWEVGDESIYTLDTNGNFLRGKEGKTTLTALYNDTSIVIAVRTVKEHEAITMEDTQDIDLDLAITSTSSERSYAVNNEKTATIQLSGESQTYGTLNAVSVDGVSYPVSQFTLDKNSLTMNVSTFGTALYGEKVLSATVEDKDTVYDFTANVLFVTKFIGTKEELETAVVLQAKGMQIFGYYALKSDIDCSGYAIKSVWATDWDYSNGFRGTLDGRGYTIKNYLTSTYGLTAQIGNGAVLKNLNFTGVIYKGGNQNSLLARGIGNATIENISIVLDTENSAPNTASSEDCGLLAYAAPANIWKNITIDATGAILRNIFGRESISDSKFENVVIKAGRIRSYAAGVTTAPNGVSYIRQ